MKKPPKLWPLLALGGTLALGSAQAQLGQSPKEFARHSTERIRALDATLEQWRTSGPADSSADIKADVIAPLDQLVNRWSRAGDAGSVYPACGQAAVRLRRIAVALMHEPQGKWFNDAHRDYQNKMTLCRHQLSR